MCEYNDYFTKKVIGLDPWTIFGHFFGPVFWDHFIGGEGRPSVLREGWDAVNQYSGRDGRQTVFTEVRAEDELLVRMLGWEVDVLVMLLIYGVFIGSYKLF